MHSYIGKHETLKVHTKLKSAKIFRVGKNKQLLIGTVVGYSYLEG